MGSRLRYLLSTPREVWGILLVCSAVICTTEILYYVYYLDTLHGLVDRDGEPFGRDFITYWTAITLLKAGNISGIYTPGIFAGALQSFLGRPIGMYWGYPPHYLFLLKPFAAISHYKIAYAAWSVLNITVFMGAVFLRSPLGASARWVMLSAPSVFIELFIGQNGLITSALLVGGFRLLASMPWVSGIFFGLLSIKPQLGILIPFILLALRQYKAFAAAAITIAVLVFASGIVFGWQVWESFFYGMQHFPQGAFHKMVSVSASLQSLSIPPSIALSIQALVAIVCAAMLCYRLSQMREAHWVDWLLLSVPAIYLATPYAFPYDLCALNAAWLLWLWHKGEATISPSVTLTWLLLWLVPPFFNQALNERGLPLTALLLMAAFALTWKETRNAA